MLAPPFVSAIPEAEILDPRSLCDNGFNDWVVTGPMVVPRRNHAAIGFPDGRVLVTGGVDGSGSVLVDAEVYQ